MDSGTTSSGTSQITVPIIYPSNCKEEKMSDMYIEQTEHRKSFSKSILNLKINEFRAGKYSKHYIETYLDFVHMEGVIDNLTYVEYKEKLSKE